MAKRDDPVVAVRLVQEERDLIYQVIGESGMAPSAWLRVVLLAACGQTELAAQIKRASKAAK